MKIVKNTIVGIILLFMFSQYAHSQIKIGLRDNQYGQLGYTWKSFWKIMLEHSIFSQKLNTQYIRFSLSYIRQWKDLGLEIYPYYGTLYNGDFYNTGLALNLQWQFIKKISIEGVINPHYDIGFGYNTCFMSGTNIYLYKNISFVAQYSTIPEYRMKEGRFRTGVYIAVGGLTVMPLLSIPIDDHSGKHIRLLMGFEYEF